MIPPILGCHCAGSPVALARDTPATVWQRVQEKAGAGHRSDACCAVWRDLPVGPGGLGRICRYRGPQRTCVPEHHDGTEDVYQISGSCAPTKLSAHSNPLTPHIQFVGHTTYSRQASVLRSTKGNGRVEQPTKGFLATIAARELVRFIVSDPALSCP